MLGSIYVLLLMSNVTVPRSSPAASAALDVSFTAGPEIAHEADMSERERELLNIVQILASEAGSSIVWGDVEKVRTGGGFRS